MLRTTFTAILLLGLAGCGGEVPVAGAPPQPVRTVVVAPLVQAVEVKGTGRVEGKEELGLAFKIGGIIREIEVDAGDQVRAGQLLATLDLQEIESEVQRAEAQAAKAERDLQRAEQLSQRRLVSTQALQDARTQSSMASAALDAARFNLRHARIEAPSDGVVLAKLAQARETVAAGVPVLSMSRADSGWVLRVGLADRNAVKVQPGDGAEVRLDALPGEVLAGRVQRLGAASDPRTGTVEVEIALPAASRPLVSGWIGRVLIHPRREGAQPLAVPVNAVLEAEGERAHLYRIDPQDGRARRVQVRVGQLRGGQVEVLEGLRAGDVVVSEGAAWLSDGAAVAILK